VFLATSETSTLSLLQAKTRNLLINMNLIGELIIKTEMA